MIEQQKPREKREMYACCMSCGFTDKTFVLLNSDGISDPITRCPKCSNRAYVCNLQGLFLFMKAVTKEVVHLKNSVFELEAASDTEER